MRISDWISYVCSSDLVISHSRINIEFDERGTVVTVIEGQAELDQAPASMLVSASEQLVVLPNGEHYKNALDPAAAERTAEWTKNYDFTAPAPEKGMSTGAKTALGILGAIVIETGRASCRGRVCQYG